MRVKDPPYLAQRGAISRALIDLLRLHARAYNGSRRPAPHVDDFLIRCAIAVGHSEGKPMSASDIAGYLALPRSSIVRRLNARSMRQGLVTEKLGRRLVFKLDPNSSPEVIKAARQAIDRVMKLSTELSNLGNKNLDQ